MILPHLTPVIPAIAITAFAFCCLVTAEIDRDSLPTLTLAWRAVEDKNANRNCLVIWLQGRFVARWVPLSFGPCYRVKNIVRVDLVYLVIRPHCLEDPTVSVLVGTDRRGVRRTPSALAAPGTAPVAPSAVSSQGR